MRALNFQGFFFGTEFPRRIKEPNAPFSYLQGFTQNIKTDGTGSEKKIRLMTLR